MSKTGGDEDADTDGEGDGDETDDESLYRMRRGAPTPSLRAGATIGASSRMTGGRRVNSGDEDEDERMASP